MVLDILKSIHPESDFARSNDFLKDGLLDSLDIINLVVMLEEKFDISIDGEDVTPEYFRNLETLELLLKKYMGPDNPLFAQM